MILEYSHCRQGGAIRLRDPEDDPIAGMALVAEEVFDAEIRDMAMMLEEPEVLAKLIVKGTKPQYSPSKGRESKKHEWRKGRLVLRENQDEEAV